MSLGALNGGEGAPPEPEWSESFTDVLDLALAREQWGIVVRELSETQTLTLANGDAIRRLIDFRVTYARAARDVAEHGALGRAKRSRVPQVNPSWSIMRQAAEQIASIEAELCISPRRRAAAGKVQRKAKTARAADAYLKPVAK